MFILDTNVVSELRQAKYGKGRQHRHSMGDECVAGLVLAVDTAVAQCCARLHVPDCVLIAMPLSLRQP